MEIFIFIVLVVVGYLIYAFVKSSEPFLRKDIEPVDEPIPLSEGKKILREFLKTNPKPFLSKYGLNANSPKREINEAIRNQVESFTYSFKDEIEAWKDEIIKAVPSVGTFDGRAALYGLWLRFDLSYPFSCLPDQISTVTKEIDMNDSDAREGRKTCL